MNIIRVMSKRPTCKTCKREMREWNPFSNEHEHVNCTSDRISKNLISIVGASLRGVDGL